MVFKNIPVFYLGSDDFPTEASVAATRDLSDAVAGGVAGVRDVAPFHAKMILFMNWLLCDRAADWVTGKMLNLPASL